MTIQQRAAIETSDSAALRSKWLAGSGGHSPPYEFSGMTNVGRIQDLADVQNVIRSMSLDVEFAESLNPYVREKYVELWRVARDDPNPQP